MTLPEKLIELHLALENAHLPHAFGGAIALAYWTRDPRGTSDIDVNVFVPTDRAHAVLAALPEGVERPSNTGPLASEGQARLWWSETPIDLFLDYDRLHTQAAANRRTVRFAGRDIPVLGPVELAVFKAMFDRTRDWADLEAMAAAGSLDVRAVETAVTELVGGDDERVRRLHEAARRGGAGHGERAG